MTEPLAEQTVTADGNRDELLAVDRVDGGHALDGRLQVVAPEHFARVGVVRAEFAVGRRAEEQQTAAGRDDSAAWGVAARAGDAFGSEARDVAVGDLPHDRAQVQVVGRWPPPGGPPPGGPPPGGPPPGGPPAPGGCGGRRFAVVGSSFETTKRRPFIGSTAELPQFAPPLCPGSMIVPPRLGGVYNPSLRDERKISRTLAWSSSEMYGLMSASVNRWRANGGGAVGNGCVGELCSPGVSDWGTGRSSIGQSGVPVMRFKT